MGKICLGYDANLGLPRDFSSKVDCDIVGYDNVSQLLDVFIQTKVDGIFTPVGSLPYLKTYQIVSQMTYGSGSHHTLQSHFVTTKDITIANISQYQLGRVNQYCTTSYWGALIYLMSFVSKGTLLEFKDTDGFNDMLNKTAEGLIDGAAVWDIILQRNPVTANKVKVIFSITDLPSPVIISHSRFPSKLCKQMNEFRTADTLSFFHGFQQPNLLLVEGFLLKIQEAISFYGLN